MNDFLYVKCNFKCCTKYKHIRFNWNIFHNHILDRESCFNEEYDSEWKILIKDSVKLAKNDLQNTLKAKFLCVTFFPGESTNLNMKVLNFYFVKRMTDFDFF